MGLYLAATVGTLAATGCVGTDDEQTPLVDVPEVRSSVELDELCSVVNEIRCAGAMGCCGAPPYASVAECMDSHTSCEAAVAEIAASELFADGTITYDPQNAARVLQSAADMTSRCSTDMSPHDAKMVLEAFFVGTRGEGEDCTASDDSGAHGLAHGLACGPELTCSADGICERLAVASSDDHEGQTEPAQSVEATYCVAPSEPAVPSNSDDMGIVTANENDAGTGGDVTLYRRKHSIHGGWTEEACTISGPISKNSTRTCTPFAIGSGGDGEYDSYSEMWIENPSNDGLKLTKVKCGSSCPLDYEHGVQTYIDYADHFRQDGNTNMGDDWVPFQFNAIWVDGDSHGNCTVGHTVFEAAAEAYVACDEGYVPAGGDKIVAQWDSSMCIDVAGSNSKSNGTNIDLWDCNHVTETWYLGSDKKLHASWNTSYCLDVEGDKETANGTNIRLSTDCTDVQETWTFEEDGKFHAVWDHSKCIDVAGIRSTTNGKNVQLWDCIDTGESFGPCGTWGASDNCGSWSTTSTNAKIRAQWDSSVCLDVVGGNLTTDKNIEIWNCDGVTETWQITDPTSDGRIRGTWLNGTNRCIDVVGHYSTTNGTNVATYDCDGGGMETWVFDPSDHKIHAQWDYDVCLDVAGVDNTANGTNIQIWQCDQVSETWDIVEQ